MGVRFGATAVMWSLTLLISARAYGEVIDFDSEKLFGPSRFTQAGPVQTLNITTSIGTVTFTGGVVISNATNVPADQTSIYGTAGNAQSIGVIADPSLTNPLTITFPKPVSNFGVDILNGVPNNTTYRLGDNLGHTFTATVPPNLSGGQTFAGFSAAGNVVTVGAVSGLPTWDYFIDNLRFNFTPNVPASIPSAPITLGSSITLPGTNPTGPVVVITHGWEPSGSPAWVSTMAQHIQSQHPDVTVVEFIAKVVSHGRYVTFQMAEVAVPRQMFQEILSLIARLRAPPAPA